MLCGFCEWLQVDHVTSSLLDRYLGLISLRNEGDWEKEIAGLWDPVELPCLNLGDLAGIVCAGDGPYVVKV